MSNKNMFYYINAVDTHFQFGMIQASTQNLSVKTCKISDKKSKKAFILYAIIIILLSVPTVIASLSIFLLKSDFLLGSILLPFSFIPICIMIFFITQKGKDYIELEPKPINMDIYKRQLPSNLRPAHVRMLLLNGVIDKKTLAATLLDLIDKGYIGMTKDKNKIDIFGSTEVVLSRIEKNTKDLFLYEKFLIKWFFEICGNGKEVSNYQIKKVLHNPEAQVSSNIYFEYFQALVKISFPLKKYYTKNKIDSSNNVKIILFFILSICLLLIPIIGTSIFAYAYGKFIFKLPLYMLNEKGVDEKDGWNDLKKYLIDFSNMKDKTSEMINLWNFYLVYSIALNIESKAYEELEEFFGNGIYKCNLNANSSQILPMMDFEQLRILKSNTDPSLEIYAELERLEKSLEKYLPTIEEQIRSEEIKYKMILD